MNAGHIKLFRQILDWEWYTDTNTTRLFIHLLLKANWKDGKFMGYDIPKGSLATSLDSLAKQTGLSIRNIRTSLDKLEKTGEIDKRTTNKFTIINIVNYKEFQDEKNKTDKQLTNDRQTTDNNIRKKERNNNIIINNNIKSFYENTKLNEVFLEYLDTRKKLKVPNSERAVSLLQKKLNEYSDDIKIKMLEEAIVNGWKSVYPLKQQKENVSFLDL